jgi:hypothetical protein
VTGGVGGRGVSMAAAFALAGCRSAANTPDAGTSAPVAASLSTPTARASEGLTNKWGPQASDDAGRSSELEWLLQLTHDTAGAKDAGRREPTAASTALGDAHLLAQGAGEGACAVQSAGAVWCWGGLGDETASFVTRLPKNTVHLALGGCMACARTTGGEVDCFGRFGATDVRRVYLPAPAVELSMGGRHMPDWCSKATAVLEDGRVFSWRMEQDLAVGGAEEIHLPGPTVHAATDGSSMCAQLRSGAVWCSWVADANSAKVSYAGPWPDGTLRPVARLSGVSEFFVRDLCVRGLFPGGMQRSVCVAETRDDHGTSRILFRTSEAEVQVTPEAWARERDGHPLCALRSDGEVVCHSAGGARVVTRTPSDAGD